jgi:colicin import membrane protein
MFTLSATTAPTAALRRPRRAASKPHAAPLRVQALAEPRSAAKQQKHSSPAQLGQAALAASLSALVVASTVAPEVVFAEPTKAELQAAERKAAFAEKYGTKSAPPVTKPVTRAEYKTPAKPTKEAPTKPVSEMTTTELKEYRLAQAKAKKAATIAANKAKSDEAAAKAAKAKAEKEAAKAKADKEAAKAKSEAAKNGKAAAKKAEPKKAEPKKAEAKAKKPAKKVAKKDSPTAEVGNTFGGAAVLAGGVWALFNLDSDEPKAPPSLPSPKTEDDDTEE